MGLPLHVLSHKILFFTPFLIFIVHLSDLTLLIIFVYDFLYKIYFSVQLIHFLKDYNEEGCYEILRGKKSNVYKFNHNATDMKHEVYTE